MTGDSGTGGAPAVLGLADLDLAGRRVLVRSDLNVPLKDGEVANAARIRASAPTFRQILDARPASLTVVSHLGRPTAGAPDARYSMAPVVEALRAELGVPVTLAPDWPDRAPDPAAGELFLAENVRFLAGETDNDPALARRMAATCDVFVMDAFGTAHRAHASTAGVVAAAAHACAGPLLVAELDALAQAFAHPARPLVAVIGGAKVAGKLELLENLVRRVDQLVVGGGIANTFLAAAGHPVGASLVDGEQLDFARGLLERTSASGNMAEIVLPTDVVVGAELSASAAATVKPLGQVEAADMILDIGPESAERLAEVLGSAGTILWNGPVGVFEHPPFAAGTQRLAEAVAASPAFSLAGGGDTIAAIEKFGVADQVSRISTGGGAFLEFLAGRTLPAVAALEAARVRVAGAAA